MSPADLGNGPTRSIPMRSKGTSMMGSGISGWGEASWVTLPGRWGRPGRTVSPRRPFPASGTGPESVGPCWPARDVPPWGVSVPTPTRSPPSYEAPPAVIFPPPSAARHSIAGPSEPQNAGEDGAQAELLFRPGSEPGPNNTSAGRPPVVPGQMSPLPSPAGTHQRKY